MISREIKVPDWFGNHVELPTEGEVEPDYSYTFFPNPREAAALREATPKQLAKMIRRQPDLTARFLHETVINGRLEVATATVEELGGAEKAIDFLDQDITALGWGLTYAFVPEDEVKRVIKDFRKMGFKRLKDPRWNGRSVDAERQAEIDANRPTRQELEEFAHKYNSKTVGHSLRDTRDLRVVDPRRKLRYVGLGNTNNYDWVDISVDKGKEMTSHYSAADKETRIALLSVY